MPEMQGVDHVSLSVTDLDRSEEFYRDVLGLVRLADFGYVRILCHRPTSLSGRSTWSPWGWSTRRSVTWSSAPT